MQTTKTARSAAAEAEFLANQQRRRQLNESYDAKKLLTNDLEKPDGGPNDALIQRLTAYEAARDDARQRGLPDPHPYLDPDDEGNKQQPQPLLKKSEYRSLFRQLPADKRRWLVELNRNFDRLASAAPPLEAVVKAAANKTDVRNDDLDQTIRKMQELSLRPAGREKAWKQELAKAEKSYRKLNHRPLSDDQKKKLRYMFDKQLEIAADTDLKMRPSMQMKWQDAFGLAEEQSELPAVDPDVPPAFDDDYEDNSMASDIKRPIRDASSDADEPPSFDDDDDIKTGTIADSTSPDIGRSTLTENSKGIPGKQEERITPTRQADGRFAKRIDESIVTCTTKTKTVRRRRKQVGRNTVLEDRPAMLTRARDPELSKPTAVKLEMSVKPKNSVKPEPTIEPKPTVRPEPTVKNEPSPSIYDERIPTYEECLQAIYDMPQDRKAMIDSAAASSSEPSKRKRKADARKSKTPIQQSTTPTKPSVAPPIVAASTSTPISIQTAEPTITRPTNQTPAWSMFGHPPPIQKPSISIGLSLPPMPKSSNAAAVPSMPPVMQTMPPPPLLSTINRPIPAVAGNPTDVMPFDPSLPLPVVPTLPPLSITPIQPIPVAADQPTIRPIPPKPTAVDPKIRQSLDEAVAAAMLIAEPEIRPAKPPRSAKRQAAIDAKKAAAAQQQAAQVELSKKDAAAVSSTKGRGKLVVKAQRSVPPPTATAGLDVYMYGVVNRKLQDEPAMVVERRRCSRHADVNDCDVSCEFAPPVDGN